LPRQTSWRNTEPYLVSITSSPHQCVFLLPEKLCVLQVLLLFPNLRTIRSDHSPRTVEVNILLEFAEDREE
jgi:hypothetical protein